MVEKQERKATKYAFATIGARTERGGRVTSGSGNKYCGLPIACVGDIVTYADGSEAVIMNGAGYAVVIGGSSAALVGSSLSNGDRIVETPWGHLDSGLLIRDGEEPPGLFDADWWPPVSEPPHRFAVRGATTPRGGVLLEVTGEYEVRDVERRAARIGDFVQYPDGSRARIITGVGIAGDTKHAYGVVGSLLDNGDCINDSPHREPRTSTIFVPVDEHGVALLEA
ncbi:PAAR domain-containing protein [Caballeronia sp. BR00000012568055]|uniref:PAAR domain-containing protein n=1 Tax=Caballeronia sp. BR00000012568055 TaxID=2918761 RepID=UPI0023F8BB64|nr:PAAR domain-containing protein [Caballeronia sp. BR00000012568055]